MAKKDTPKTAKQLCKERGWIWDEATNSCNNPNQPITMSKEWENNQSPSNSPIGGQYNKDRGGFVTDKGELYPTTNPDFRPQERYEGVTFNRDGTVEVRRGQLTQTLTKEEYKAYQDKGGNITNKVQSLRSAPTEQEALMQQQLSGLETPTNNELITEDNWVENNIPVFGPIAASLVNSFTNRGGAKVGSGSEAFGAIVESLGLSRLPFGIGTFIGKLTNAPGQSAKTLLKQVPNIERDVRNAVRRATNSQEAIHNLDNLAIELNLLETQIQQNVIRSAELRANPEDIDKIQRDILSTKSLMLFYKRELIVNPQSLSNLQLTLGVEEIMTQEME